MDDGPARAIAFGPGSEAAMLASTCENVRAGAAADAWWVPIRNGGVSRPRDGE